MSVEYTKSAVKSLEAMARNVRENIIERIDRLAADPDHDPQVKALKASDVLRLRVGNWRVLFRRTSGAVRVIDVLPRGSAYK